MSHLKQKLRKYFIMGSQNCQRHPADILTDAIQGGVTTFQFREKGKGALTGKAKLELGQQLREICRQNDVLFIINDDIDLVEPLDVDGIHVGQGDTPIEELRQRFPKKTIGLSVSNQQEVNQSPIELVDYLGAGPIFATITKEEVKTPVGLEWIQSLRRQFPPLPLVGIGGISPQNASTVIAAGADGISVVSAITNSDHIIETVQQL